VKDLSLFPLWTALVTPMLENGEVDYPSLQTLLDEQNKAGNGILILGSTGESLNLDENEKKEILNFVCNQSLDVPLMAGVGGVNLKKTKEWIKHLETLPLDCYLLVTPLYAKPGTIGQTHWFKSLMDMSTKPVILYNVPSRTGTSLSLDTVAELSSHPNFWGIKEASGSVEEFKKYREAAPNAKIYSGDDGMLPDFAPHGAYGLISVASNVWPFKTHQITKWCLEKTPFDIKTWKECCDTLFLVSNPIPAKALLNLKGKIKFPHLRAPLSHLESFDQSKLNWAHEKVSNLSTGEKEL